MQPSVGPFQPYPQPGEILDGKYRIDRLLGEGGMGAVAKATHLLRRAPVALKFMSPAVLSFPGAVERFVNEGVAASQINSDHVVKVFDVGRLPSGAPYLVMEFLDGRDLGQLLEAEGPRLPTARAVHFTLQILRALQTAHAAGIVHRDMKPSNVFVIEKDAEHDFVKLVDFGISKLRSQDDGQAPSANLTRTNSALGTPLYMSPEQARSPRDVDPRTDVYSVGAILYEMLCGRTPYTAESGEYTEILFKLFTTEPEPIRSLSPDVPEGLAAIVHRALQRDRNARFGSAAEMALALAPYADARSQEVMSRVLAVHGRSTRPPVSADLTPPTRDAPVGHEPAHAQTFATGPGDVPRAPRVPTDVGVTRESAGSTSSSSGSRKAWIGGFAAAAAAIGLAAGAVVVTRGHGATPDRPTAPGSTSAEAPGTPGPGRSVAPSSNLPSEGASSAIVDAPAVGLPPAPDAAVSAHSQVTPEPKAPPPRPPPSAATALPKQLGELILK